MESNPDDRQLQHNGSSSSEHHNSSSHPAYELLDHRQDVSPQVFITEQILGYVYFVLFLVGLLSNLLAIVIFLDFRIVKRGRKFLASTHLFLHLAFADLMSSCFVFPFNGYVLLKQMHQWHDPAFMFVCNVSGAVFNICSRQSVNIFALISLGRCVAAIKPLHYTVWYTTTRVRCMLAITWILSLTLSCIPYLTGKNYHYNHDISMCTFTLDDILVVPNVSRRWRSATYFIVVVLPIILPILVTMVTLSSLISFLSNGRKYRERLTRSFSDISEISEGFAEAMNIMLDTRARGQRVSSVKTVTINGQDYCLVNMKRLSRVRKSRSSHFEVPKAPLITTCAVHKTVIFQSLQEEPINTRVPPTISTSGAGTTCTHEVCSPAECTIQVESNSGTDCPGNLQNLTNSPNLTKPNSPCSASFRHRASMIRTIKHNHHVGPKNTVHDQLKMKVRRGRTRRKHPMNNRKAMNKQSHAFVTLLIIGLLFGLSYSMWSFLFVCGFITTLTQDPGWNIFLWLQQKGALMIVLTSAIVLSCLSSCSTPLIHIFRGNSMRNKLKKRGTMTSRKDQQAAVCSSSKRSPRLNMQATSVAKSSRYHQRCRRK